MSKKPDFKELEKKYYAYWNAERRADVYFNGKSYPYEEMNDLAAALGVSLKTLTDKIEEDKKQVILEYSKAILDKACDDDLKMETVTLMELARAIRVLLPKTEVVEKAAAQAAALKHGDLYGVQQQLANGEVVKTMKALNDAQATTIWELHGEIEDLNKQIYTLTEALKAGGK